MATRMSCRVVAIPASGPILVELVSAGCAPLLTLPHPITTLALEGPMAVRDEEMIGLGSSNDDEPVFSVPRGFEDDERGRALRALPHPVVAAARELS